MLSQLSYDPKILIYKLFTNKTTRMGFEPTTSAVTGRRSNQLSHRAIFKGIYIPSKPHTEQPSHNFFLFPKPSGQALDRLVSVSSVHCCTSTSDLSTSSSSRGLTLAMGYLILRGASRLDAFSVYPVQTWLPCHGLGKPTGTPAVCPSRSSRTKDSSSQISYARAG